MDIQDRILAVVVNTQEDVKDLKERVVHLEDTNDRTFNKLDGFLVLINRYESEIAALRSSYMRLDERLTHIEKAIH